MIAVAAQPAVRPMAPRPYQPWKMGALCSECPLNDQTPVAATGPLDAPIVFVGEGPGKLEVLKGEAFVGPSGAKLAELLYQHKVQRTQVYVTNSVCCLDGKTRVRMADGTQRAINEIVKFRVQDAVQAVDVRSGRLVTAPITGWYRTPLGTRTFLKVSSRHAKGNPRGVVGSVMTNDHLVLTTSGWVESERLTSQHLIATGHQALTGAGYDLVIGSMLGDGQIPRVGANYLSISHVESNRDYIEAKAQVLSLFGSRISRVVPKHGEALRCLNTIASPWLGEIHEAWYGPGKIRRIPRDLRLSDFSLAIAFFDNGYMRKRGGRRQASAEIATNRFSEEDVRFLAMRIREDLHLNAGVRYGAGWRLSFDVEATKRLSWLIAGHAVPSMRYKILEEHQDAPRNPYYPVPPTTYWDTPVVEPVERIEKTVYCIDVERYHNFVTTNAVVHNCRPEVPGIEGKRRFEMKSYVAWFRKQNQMRKKAGFAVQKSPFECCAPRLKWELDWLEHHARARGAPNGAVVVPLGNFALAATTALAGVEGKVGGVLKYRGSILQPGAQAK